ncbi:hypothetical protein C2857_001904 [Epichloe festucae Fl1]|uniref:Uncharacterized protein n=1 Tax=Epichloe festucae (strain Fl1) TaxID=877507 RepID=A0A7S9KUE4_EPIFF|nr:hypothetical protein C2857_001904 [Epichloe festucae Fl1]
MYAGQLIGFAMAMASAANANPDAQTYNAGDEHEASPPGCTKTIFGIPPWTAGPTRTIWTTTTTSTKYVDCGGCTAVARSYLPLGPGPVLLFTTTVTAAEPKTTSVLACGKPDCLSSTGNYTTERSQYTLAPV